MAKQLNFTYNGKDYTLEYTRRTVTEMEKKGFIAAEVEQAHVHSPGSFRGRISRPSSLREEGSYQCDFCEADEQGGADRQAG